MPSIILNTQLTDIFGEPLVEKIIPESSTTPEKRIAWTVKSAIIAALMASAPDTKESGDEKFKKWLLASKVQKRKQSIVFSAEEIVQIKAAAGTIFPTILIGALYIILDPPASVVEEVEEIASEVQPAGEKE